jgi:glycosyltransferase involved in cell wall biosynthesis
MNRGKKIMVSHSGRQYVHQLLFALSKYGFEFCFYTSFCYKREKFPFTLFRLLPAKLRQITERELRKRMFHGIDDHRINQFPYFELVREVLDKVLPARYSEYLLYFRDRMHDLWVSRKIKNDQYGLVIGYEECCYKTFKEAKKKGLTTVLDLAQIHYREISKISSAHPVFGKIYVNKKLRERINSIKQKELSLSDYIICLSTFARDSLINNGLPAEKIFIANLGFDPSKFIPKKEYSVSEKLKLVYAGTLTKRKGLDLLIDAMDELSSIAELILIGPMGDAGTLITLNTHKFTWFPYLEQEEMNKIFNSSDVFVFPSYLDSWAMVVIEAMACGLPVIISNQTGSKDAVTTENGFIVPAGNKIAFINKVKYFYENRQELSAMGKKSRNIAEKYDWDQYYTEIKNIISKIQNV